MAIYMYIMDRAKDLIIRGGENISCSEVENCLYQLPEIVECAVFGLPDERLGETVAAAVFMAGESHPRELVELDASAGGSMARIGAHAKANLAHFKVPRRIFQWPAPGLPRGATGKLLKKAIQGRAVASTAAPKSRL